MLQKLVHSSLTFNTSRKCLLSSVAIASTPTPEVSSETLAELGHDLRDYAMTDQRLSRISDNSLVTDKAIEYKMQNYQHVARSLITSRLLSPSKVPWASGQGSPHISQVFLDNKERSPFTFNSPHTLYDYLALSKMQRKMTRRSIAESAVKYDTWCAAVKTMLAEFDADLKTIQDPSGFVKEGIDATGQCLELLNFCDPPIHGGSVMNYPSLNPSPNPDAPESKPSWGDIFHLLNIITYKLGHVEALHSGIKLIKGMKEGFKHINSIRLNNRSPEDMQLAQLMVKDRLWNNLGNPSNALFVLWNFYLLQSAGYVSVDLQGRKYLGDDGETHLCMGEIATCVDGDGLWRSVKHLHRALQLVNHTYHTATFDKPMRAEGHIWAVGAEENSVTYENVPFFVHGLDS